MTLKDKKKTASHAVKCNPSKGQDHYGVFNHMIEDNINYIIGQNSIKWRIIGWVVYAIIILFLVYISFTY